MNCERRVIKKRTQSLEGGHLGTFRILALKAVIYVFFFRFENAISNTLYHLIVFNFKIKIQENAYRRVNSYIAANTICCYMWVLVLPHDWWKICLIVCSRILMHRNASYGANGESATAISGRGGAMRPGLASKFKLFSTSQTVLSRNWLSFKLAILGNTVPNLAIHPTCITAYPVNTPWLHLRICKHHLTLCGYLTIVNSGIHWFMS